jgi:purine catabolism regulator
VPLTVADVLSLDCMQRGRPEVLAGAASLDRRLRWAHVSEVAEIGRFLTGEELVLTTGVAMAPSSAAALDFVDQVVRAGAAGLVLELGRTCPRVPDAALARVRDAGLPLVVLHRPVRFVEVTEAIHRALAAEQLAEVEQARAAHEVFTELSLGDADPGRIVAAAADLSGGSVVLEDLGHRVLAFRATDRTTPALLEDWERRSRLTPVGDATGRGGPEGWLTTPVGIRGGPWGRLVLVGPAPSRAGMVLERAAQALELGRMMEREAYGAQLRAQGGFLLGLLEGGLGTEADAVSRLAALGVRPGRRYLGLAVRTAGPAPARVVEVSEALADALRSHRVAGVVGVLDPDHVAAVLAVASVEREEVAVGEVAAALTEALGPHVRVGVGPSQPRLLEAAASVRSARLVVDVATAMPPSARGYHRHADVRVRGLLASLADDPRLQGFAEAELGALLAHESRHADGSLDLLRRFLAVGGNKAALARTAHRNRTSLYPRLHRLEEVLGLPLDEPESRLSLGVAVLAHDLAHGADDD